MFYVYILFSDKLNRYYIGTTDNVGKRLEEHNSNAYQDSYTSKGIPWVLKVHFLLDSSKQAYDLEKFIKRMKSKVFIEKLIQNPDIVKEILNKV